MSSAHTTLSPTAISSMDERTIRKIVVASIAGNAMERYDFFAYGTAMAIVFGQLFFPVGPDPLLGTLGAFAAFAMGFVARPLGGVVFGHIGDRLGRKASLVWTLSMLVMSSAVMLAMTIEIFAMLGWGKTLRPGWTQARLRVWRVSTYCNGISALPDARYKADTRRLSRLPSRYSRFPRSGDWHASSPRGRAL
jgi:MFS family permease